MCCESCPKVAHYQCIGLKTAPKGEWYCPDCTAKRASAAARKKEKQAKQKPVSNIRMNSSRGGR